jgi:hypothetical protein
MMMFLRWVWVVVWMAVVSPAWAAEWSVPPEDVVLDAPMGVIPEHFVTVDGIAAQVHGGHDDRVVLVALARHAAERLPELAAALGVPIGGPIDVFVAGSQAEFQTMQPGVPPDWAGGTAWPRQGLVYLKSPRAGGPNQAPLEQVLDHELVHVLVGRALGAKSPPAWLQEGLAQVLAGELGPEDGVVLARGVSAGMVPSVESLMRGFPSEAGRARLAYAQSAHFVAWIREAHGDEALRVVLREMAGGASAASALRAATGDDLATLEQRWKDTLEVPGAPRWLALLGSGELWWAFVGVAGLAAVITARRRLNRRMKEMAEKEAIVDALLARFEADEAVRYRPPGGELPKLADDARYGPH